jgi:hypothetical protein
VIGTRISADTYSLESRSEFAAEGEDRAVRETKVFDLSNRRERATKLEARALAILAPVRNDVALAVSRYLQSCPNFELRRVICSVDRGELTICGQVSSYYLKQLAQESVRSQAKGHRIINRLLVVNNPNHRDELKAHKGSKS